jgi:hypothetical protein
MARMLTFIQMHPLLSVELHISAPFYNYDPHTLAGTL